MCNTHTHAEWLNFGIKVSFFVQRTKMQLITPQNFNLENFFANVDLKVR